MNNTWVKLLGEVISDTNLLSHPYVYGDKENQALTSQGKEMIINVH